MSSGFRVFATAVTVLPGCAAVLVAAAQPASAETLADAVALAYANNPTVVGERFSQRSRDEDYVQARSQYGPTLNAQAAGTYGHQTVGTRSADGQVNQFTLSLSQPLYTSGRLRGQVAAAKAEVLGGREQLRSTEQSLIRSVIIVYASVIRDEARLRVGQENVEVLRQQLEENRARRRSGDLTLTDVGQADARYAAAEIQLATLQQSLDVSRGQYLQIVGRNPGVLAPLPELNGLPPTIDMAFDAAERSNPDLSASRFAEQQSRGTAAAVRGERGPTVSASAQALYNNRLFHLDGGATRSKEVTAGLTLTQSIFANGAIASRVRQAEARNQADQAAIDEERRVTFQTVTSAWSQLTAARLSLASGERQVSSAQLAFAGMAREQRYGLRSTIDTLNAEQELQAAQLNFLQNRYLEYTARATLLAAMGTLEPQAISTGVQAYDPVANFKRVTARPPLPTELIARGVDRIGSAPPHKAPSPVLSGRDVPRPAGAAPLPAQPTPAQKDGELTPITQSQLVPSDSLPGGMPGEDAPRALQPAPAAPPTPRP